MDRHSDVSPLASRHSGSNKWEEDTSPSLARYTESTSKEQPSRSYHVQEIKDIRRVAYKDEYGGNDRVSQGTSAQRQSSPHDVARYVHHDDLENVRSSANNYSNSKYNVLSDPKVRHEAEDKQHDRAKVDTEWHRTITSVPKGKKSRWSPNKFSFAHQDELSYQQSSNVLLSRKSRSPTSRHSSDSEISHTSQRKDRYFRKTKDVHNKKMIVSPDTSMASGRHYHSRSPSIKRSTHRLPLSRSRSGSYSPKAESHSSRHHITQSDHKHKDVTEQYRGRTISRYPENQPAKQSKEYRSRSDKSEDTRLRSSDALSKPLVLSGSEGASRSLPFGRWDSPDIQVDGLMMQRRFEQRMTSTDRTLLKDVKASVSSITSRMGNRSTAQKFESVDSHNLPDIVSGMPGLVVSKQGTSREVIVGKKVQQGNPVSDIHQAASQSRATGSGRNEGKNDTGSIRSKSKDVHRNQKPRKDHKPVEKKRDKSSSSSRHRSKKRREKSRKKQRHHSKKGKKLRRRSSSSSSSSWSSSSSRTNRKRSRRRSSSSRSSSSSSSSSSSYSRSPKRKRLSMDPGKQKEKVSISYVSAVKRPSFPMEKLPGNINPQPNKTLSELEKFLLLLKQKKKEQTGSEKK